MKCSLILTLPLLCVQLASAQSNIPGSISYQGRVSDAAGILIGETVPVNREVILRIYGSPTGTDVRYAEKQTVTISKGQLSLLLGTGLQVGSEPKPDLASALDGGNQRFLGVTVDDGTATADPEISPRQQIISSAFALRARRAETSASTDFATTSGSAQSVQARANDNSTFNWINAANLTVNGHSKISGQNVLELGIGRPRNDNNAAGQIGYQTFSNGLDILGAVGDGSSNDRRITMWAEAGTDFRGPITFGSRLGQHINLYSDAFGFGIENSTLFSRSADRFVWYRGGNSNGGGSEALRVDGNGLTVQSGNFYVPNGRMVATIDRGGHGVFAGSFGDGHSFGSQDYTTFSRTSRNFAWYVGGAWNGIENDPGGGNRVAVMDANGLRLQGQGAGGTSIELGYGVAGKEGSAGTISYKRFTEGLDIVGAGNGGNRKVQFWAEGGTYFSGPIILQGAQRIANFGFGGDADTLGNNGVQATNNQSASDVVLNAWGGRIVAERFTATSDSRIKNVLASSHGAQDLATLMKVQITDYTMKDDPAKKPAVHKKVIAQQVEGVFPQAVSSTEGPVPDIMTAATAKEGFVALDGKVLALVKQGDVLKVWTKQSLAGGPETKLTKVSKVTKEGIQLEDKLEGNLFIYGHQVNDLRSVDYESISMLNVSATQELYRTIEKQAAQIIALQEANTALQQELADSHTEDQAQESRLAVIEKALKLETPKAASQKKATGKVAAAASPELRR